MSNQKENQIPPRPSYEAIAKCAFDLWEKDGRPAGRDKFYMIQAEKKLMACYAHKRSLKDAVREFSEVFVRIDKFENRITHERSV